MHEARTKKASKAEREIIFFCYFHPPKKLFFMIMKRLLHENSELTLFPHSREGGGLGIVLVTE